VKKRDVMILLLALAGAGVDAMMIMGFNVLTAAQTGNTILLAVALARGQFALGLSAGVSVIAYVIGAALGEVFLVRQSGTKTSGIAATLLAEAALLGILLVLWRIPGTAPSQAMGLVLVAIAAVAMGIQSAAVRCLHNGPTTTYITGLLTSFTTGAIRAFLAPGNNGRSSGDSPWQYGTVWATYLAGAVACGLVYLFAGPMALLLPMASIAAVIALGPRRC